MSASCTLGRPRRNRYASTRVHTSVHAVSTQNLAEILAASTTSNQTLKKESLSESSAESLRISYVSLRNRVSPRLIGRCGRGQGISQILCGRSMDAVWTPCGRGCPSHTKRRIYS